MDSQEWVTMTWGIYYYESTDESYLTRGEPPTP